MAARAESMLTVRIRSVLTVILHYTESEKR